MCKATVMCTVHYDNIVYASIKGKRGKEVNRQGMHLRFL